jgi:prepilin-type N-terminal cleavage/methylation domain-containing protein
MMRMSLTRGRRGFSLLEMIFTLAISMVLMAIAAPMMGNALGYYRLSGDARALSNAISVAKMRAASDFTQARLFVDLTAGYHLETFKKTPAPNGSWTTEGGTTNLSGTETFGFGGLAAAPLNTQNVITQGVTGSAPCKDVTGANIANSVCILFNSRGIPVDTTGAPTGAGALYITDGAAVYGITISATGSIITWQSPASTASWIKQ